VGGVGGGRGGGVAKRGVRGRETGKSIKRGGYLLVGVMAHETVEKKGDLTQTWCEQGKQGLSTAQDEKKGWGGKKKYGPR